MDLHISISPLFYPVYAEFWRSLNRFTMKHSCFYSLTKTSEFWVFFAYSIAKTTERKPRNEVCEVISYDCDLLWMDTVNVSSRARTTAYRMCRTPVRYSIHYHCNVNNTPSSDSWCCFSLTPSSRSESEAGLNKLNKFGLSEFRRVESRIRRRSIIVDKNLFPESCPGIWMWTKSRIRVLLLWT